MRTGIIKDTHVQANDGDGAGPKMRDNIADLMGSRGCADWWHLGDMVGPNDGESGLVPHIPTEDPYYENFWGYVEDSGYYDDLQGALVSHHDAPTKRALRSDPKATRFEVVEYPNAGVTAILIDTAAGASTTGSPAAPVDKQGAEGVSVGYISEREYRLLKRALDDAEDRGDAQLVMPHHHLYFQTDTAADTAGTPGVFAANDTMMEGNNYWLVQNYRDVHALLSNYSKVFCVQAHLYQFTDYGSRTVDGVTYTYSKHWSDVGNSTFYPYHYVDIDSSSATMTAVQQGGGTYTVGSQTF